MLVPTVGDRGKFSAKPPYVLSDDAVWTVQSVRTIDSFRSAGIDPFRTAYYPCEFTREKYEEDLKNNPFIVEFVSDGGTVKYVPTTYIQALPEKDTPEYKRMIISVDLGVLPMNVETSHVLREMADMASQLTGVAADARMHLLNYDGVVTKQRHAEMEAERSGRLGEAKTSYTENIRLRNTLKAITARYRLLKDNL